MSAAVSRVVVERVARCPFSVAHDYVEDFLRDAQEGLDVRLPLRDFFSILRGHMRRPVRLKFASRPDETEGGRGHDAMRLGWRAGTRFFPDFHGTLRLRIDTVETTRLTLEGTYRPPLGIVGRVFDAAVGARVARSSIGELLDRIVAALEAREAAFLASDSGPSGSAG